MPEKQVEIKQDPDRQTYSHLVELFNRGLDELAERMKTGLRNMADFTFMFAVDNAPMSMENFFMFEELFDVLPVAQFLAKTARQVAKTTSAGAADTLQRLTRPGSNSLTVTPLFSQAKRISSEIVGPMIGDSMFQDEILFSRGQQTILQRKITGGGTQHYSYALLDAMRIRSLNSIDHLWVDEVQHVRANVLPVIEQVQAGRPFTRWRWYTGTPLSMGNLIEMLWEKSSQGEQAIKCEHCSGNIIHHGWNVGCTEQQLQQMIGPTGVICAYCGKPLDVFKQVFVPRYRDREEIFKGRHISQVLHPLHACIKSQWAILLKNRQDYNDAEFANEILGESYDSADRMIDLPTLREACVLGANTFQEALDRRDELEIRGMGIDWGGGGDTHSYTKIVFGGLRRGASTVDIHCMITLPQSLPPQAQMAEVLSLQSRYQPNILAHDYTAMGWVFEGLGLHSKVDAEVIWPFTYGFSPTRDVVYVSKATDGSRSSLHLDHTRSLFALYTMIKGHRVRFPDFDSQQDKISGLHCVSDFLAMFAERKPSAHAGDILYVKRDPGSSDDYVHATNFLATACWYRAGSYPSVPDLFQNARLTHTEEEMLELEGQWLASAGDDGTYVA